MKTLKNTLAGLPYRGGGLLIALLTFGLLSGCQVEPTPVEFLPISVNKTFLQPTVDIPPPAVTAPPEAEVERQPELADIATREFSIADEQRIVGGLAAISTQEGDTLPDIARHFDVGSNDISLANPDIPRWTPRAGSRVLLPTQFILPDAPRKGIVLNLAVMRVFYYPPKQPGVVFTYPVGIGREGWNTPLGQTTVVAKKVDPTWVPPESIRREHAAQGDPLPRAVPPGPDNPLGKFALGLGFKSYLMHGTNKPYGVGMRVSHGCIRLYPEDIEVLFEKATAGTPVRIVHQPYLAAWNGDMLYLEAHTPLEKWAEQGKEQQQSLLTWLHESAAEKGGDVDWEKVERILQRADGVPTPVLAGSPDMPELAAQAPEVQHPGQFYVAAVVPELTESDWALLVADFKSAQTAQQLAAILNHLGPPIPARKVAKEDSFEVIAGPFKDQQETESAAETINIDFGLDSKPIPPAMATEP